MNLDSNDMMDMQSEYIYDTGCYKCCVVLHEFFSNLSKKIKYTIFLELRLTRLS